MTSEKVGDWIEINLPWYIPSRLTPEKLPDPPDLSEECYKLFGVKNCYEIYDLIENNPHYQAYVDEKEVSDRLFYKFAWDATWSDEESENLREAHLQEGFKDHPEYQKLYALQKKARQVYRWEDAHSKTIEYEVACANLNKQQATSFVERGLVQPGIQFEMSDGTRYLVGDLDCGGDVGNESPVDDEDIVVRYRVLLTKEILES